MTKPDTSQSEPQNVAKADHNDELRKANPLLKFLSYFWSQIPWMIEVAVILSDAVGHRPDFFMTRKGACR